jgi:hypothetical protein
MQQKSEMQSNVVQHVPPQHIGLLPSQQAP